MLKTSAGTKAAIWATSASEVFVGIFFPNFLADSLSIVSLNFLITSKASLAGIVAIWDWVNIEPNGIDPSAKKKLFFKPINLKVIIKNYGFKVLNFLI